MMKVKSSQNFIKLPNDMTPKTQDLNLNKTRKLQNFAFGPDLAARAKRLEVTFIYRKGAEGPPTFTRGPVRARARAR